MKKNLLLLGLLFMCICTISFSVNASAATFCVSDATGLQNALTTASANGEDDLVQIQQGTYVGNFVYASAEACGVTIEGGYTSGCASREVDPANTVLDGDALRTVLALSCPEQAVGFAVDGVTLQNGNASQIRGGGLFANATNGEITLTNNTISGNSSDFGGGGGGVYASGTTVTLTNNTISGNSSDFGGGVYASGTTVTLTNNTISGNSSGFGGGGVYAGITNGTMTLTNNTITGNSSDYSGGGVYAESYHGITLTNNTIMENSSSNNGGGVLISLYENTSIASIYNNVIWYNTADSEGKDLYINNDRNGDFLPSIVNLFNNDFDQSAAGTFIKLPFPIDPSNLVNADPLFVDPLNGDYHLTATSPCINAGDNNAPELPEFDKDGQPRIIDGTVDMGAYEYTGTLPPAARFSADPLRGMAPFEVQFSNQSIGEITSWTWNFGDGGNNTEQNPVHTYRTKGVFTVSLTVTGPLGSDTETKTDYITVTGEAPVPDIKANGSDGPITVSPSTPISIAISLNAGDKSGQTADWWIAVSTPFPPPGDWYTYVHPIGFMLGINLCAQAGLFDLAPYEVLDMTLPVGTYTFYFALDDPDGMATGPWWGLDKVEVTVSAGPPVGTLSLSADPSAITTGGGTTLTATLLDADNAPMPYKLVTLSVSEGTGTFTPLSPWTTNVLGKAEGKFTLTGSKSVIIKGEAQGATGTVTVNYSVYSFTLTANPASIGAGGKTSLITATLKKLGVPVPGKTVTFTTTLGTIAPLSENTGEDGKASAWLTAGDQTGAAVVEGTVNVGTELKTNVSVSIADAGVR